VVDRWMRIHGAGIHELDLSRSPSHLDRSPLISPHASTTSSSPSAATMPWRTRGHLHLATSPTYDRLAPATRSLCAPGRRALMRPMAHHRASCRRSSPRRRSRCCATAFEVCRSSPHSAERIGSMRPILLISREADHSAMPGTMRSAGLTTTCTGDLCSGTSSAPRDVAVDSPTAVESGASDGALRAAAHVAELFEHLLAAEVVVRPSLKVHVTPTGSDRHERSCLTGDAAHFPLDRSVTAALFPPASPACCVTICTACPHVRNASIGRLSARAGRSDDRAVAPSTEHARGRGRR